MKPSAPILLEIVGVTEDSVTLSWLSPERDGGSRIFSYIIECREAGKPDSWVRVKKVDSSEILVACIEGLKDGTAYLFRVYAENEMGAGPPATLREQVIPRGQLGKLVIWVYYLVTINVSLHRSNFSISLSHCLKVYIQQLSCRLHFTVFGKT